MDPLAKRKMWHVLSKLTTGPKVTVTHETVNYESVTCVTVTCVIVILVTA
jgi:hypothetical protein